MKRVKLHKLMSKISIILIVSFIFSVSTENYYYTYAEKDLSQSYNYAREGTYDAYIQQYEHISRIDKEIILEGNDYSDSDMPLEVLENFCGLDGYSVKTLEEGFVEWKFNLETESLYNIEIEYYPIEGRSSEIERRLYLNSEVPFSGANNLVFTRVWKDANDITRDNRDNDLRPSQIESPFWRKSVMSDFTGYYSDPYLFYFKEGVNTLRLESVKEPMVIRKIRLFQVDEVPDYASLSKEYEAKGYEVAKNQYIKIQGENASYKSDPTLYPISDRSSPATEPYDCSKIRLNTIGGYRWMHPGQWIIWEIEVDEPGLYQIGIKFRQNIVSGSFSNRRLTIDDEVPFKEMEDITFNYGNRWQMNVLGDEEPYLFYLEKGTHQLKLETTLGGMADILRVAEESVYLLNSVYRKIIMITSATPDSLRDYRLEFQIPDAIEMLEAQSEALNQLSKRLAEYTGQRGSQVVVLDRLSYQLKDLASRPDTIPNRLASFKGNLGFLAQWILNTSYQPLEIDYIVFHSPEQELPKPDAGFFGRLIHEARAIIASYFEDYDSIGDFNEDGTESITVWIGTGRDQAQIIKNLIEETFTPEKGVFVNLQLVQGGVLLPATVAGMAPDVALQVPMEDPVNYAMRGGVINLAQFEDYKEIATRFHPSAIVPYQFREGVYALPEQQTFSMLFYRTDVLAELNLAVPQTWDDIFEILPDLQKNNMDFGIPISELGVGAGIVSYAMLLYQRGGRFFLNDGIASDLGSEIAIDAFETWTTLYANYKLPLQYNIANRFRIGETPLAIADYSLYNQLSVFAPEIKGLWDFAPVPGIMQQDGTINRSVPGMGTAAVILSQTENKESSWEFLKWWTSKDVQVRFGREMESLMGAAARYPTANIEALAQLPWSVQAYNKLMEQWEWVEGIPQVPGGYFVSRHLDNAFRSVVFHGTNPRETLLDYVRVINEEIDNKRLEFGLEVRK